MIQTIISWASFGATAGALLLIFILNLRKRIFPWRKIIFFLVLIQLAGIFVTAFFFTKKIQDDSLDRYLLRPDSPYIWQQVITLLRPFVAGWLAAGALFAILAWVFIRRTRERLLDRTDVMLLTISVAAVGWPTVFILLGMTFAFTVVGMLVMVAMRRRTLADRLIITPFIIPAALVTLALEPWLLNLTGLIKIRF